MSTELSPLASVQQKIQDRIKGEFVSLIPDEMWEQMVRTVVHDFTTDKPNRYNHSQLPDPAPIKTMIKAEIEELVKGRIKVELDKAANSQWDAMAGRVVSEAVKELASTHFKTILESMQSYLVEAAVQAAVMSMRNSMMR